MIRLARGPEPAELTSQRDEHLPRAREAIRVGQEPDLRGYQVAKNSLYKAQDHNCAYCEAKQPQAAYRDIDHFRPKALYWWLAWSWNNLLFSCEVCNRSHKKDLFPLRDAAQRLQAEEEPPGREQPLLLDPFDATIDLPGELVFRPVTIERKQRWQPVGLTERGRRTIEVCGLDRPALLDAYATHVNQQVRPLVDKVRERSQSGADRRTLEESWRHLRRALDCQQFRALSRCAVTHLLQKEIEAHGLHWPVRS